MLKFTFSQGVAVLFYLYIRLFINGKTCADIYFTVLVSAMLLPKVDSQPTTQWNYLKITDKAHNHTASQ